jgi:uncharacterized protein (TIGR02452 family)
MDRGLAEALGRETVGILEAGWYRAPSGKVVDVRERLQAALAGTRTYGPGAALPESGPGERETRIEVRNETTLVAAERMARAGQRAAALNFASAMEPGGGFLRGARAQEESLARSSGLYACLRGNEMYEYHWARDDPMYADYVIYSPEVPVFRRDDGTLLEEPYGCSMITSPAVMAYEVMDRMPERAGEIEGVMRGRMERVLRAARLHGHSHLILGAWGCGAFGNDGRMVAGLFGEALRGRHRGAFETVVFSITDWSEEKRFIGPFEAVFREELRRLPADTGKAGDAAGDTGGKP